MFRRELGKGYHKHLKGKSMVNLQLLNECIEEYADLKALRGITEQQRGQKFNALIAKALSAHYVHAVANQRNIGEIDVAFRINDKRFILEAKWESSKINIDPISKLGLRVNQRIPNNLGIIISMSGYTSEALAQMQGAGRPNVLLIEKDIFEVLLHANIDAEALFDACVDVAAFEGKMHILLSDVFKYLPKRNINITIKPENDENFDNKEISALQPTSKYAEYKILKAGLPFGQNGISIANGIVFVTLTDGVYQLDKGHFTKAYDIDNPQNRCIFDSEKQVLYFVKNGSVMSIDNEGKPSSVSRRYPGHVRLFSDNKLINLFSNGGESFSDSIQPVRLIKDITAKQIEFVSDYPIGSCTDACFLDNDGCAIIGSSGLRAYKGTNQIWSLDVLNGASVSHFNEKIYFLENGVFLKSIALNGKNVTDICKFNLSGSVGDFTIINESEFVFHLCYQESGKTKTAIVYVKTSQ